MPSHSTSHTGARGAARARSAGGGVKNLPLWCALDAYKAGHAPLGQDTPHHTALSRTHSTGCNSRLQAGSNPKGLEPTQRRVDVSRARRRLVVSRQHGGSAAGHTCGMQACVHTTQCCRHDWLPTSMRSNKHDMCHVGTSMASTLTTLGCAQTTSKPGATQEGYDHTDATPQRDPTARESGRASLRVSYSSALQGLTAQL